MTLRALVVFGVAFTLIQCSTFACAENWPRFRGPGGQGISEETDPPLHWSPTENIAWKTLIPGQGWSSPVVWGDRVFLTTTTEEGRSCHVLCLDKQRGGVLWNKHVFDQEPKHMRAQNSHATPTPVTDGELVYAVFSTGRVVALDFSGEEVWNTQAVEFFSQHGLGASPILHGDMLIMPFDGSSPGEDPKVGFKIPWEGAVVMALDKRTGEPVWEAKRGLSRLAHVTPQVVSRQGAMRLISAAGDAIQGHDASTGELLWTAYSQGEGVTPSIVVGDDDLIYTCSGFEAPTIRAVRLGGSGEVTESHMEWEQRRGVPSLSSLLYVEPHLYSVTDAGVLHCLDAATGEVVWRTRIGGKHSASPIYADGHVYTLSETDGETVVFKPGAEYEEVTRNRLGELCKASIAVSDGRFYVRGESHLFCIEKQSE